MADQYFVIKTTEDGSTLREMTKEALEAELAEMGDRRPAPHDLSRKWGTDLTAEAGYTIIKGRIVAPKPVEVVTKYEV